MRTPLTAPESLPSRFDAELDAAVHSRLLADLVRTAFDESAPPGVLGFSFVTMDGLAHIADRAVAIRTQAHARLPTRQLTAAA